MGRITWRGGTAKKETKGPLAVHVGQQLLKLRAKHQLSLKALSEASSISCAFLCDVENGRSMPSIETVWKLATYFEVPIGYFVRGFEP